MWDLAISEHGDLVMTGHADLGGKSGTDLLEQRMIIRMKLTRGAWVFDDTGSLGSQLSHVVGMSPDKAAAVVPAYVREALRDVDEVSVQDIQIATSAKAITILVLYTLSGQADQSVKTLQFSLPLAGEGA